jgi:hypothetical protein
MGLQGGSYQRKGEVSRRLIDEQEKKLDGRFHGASAGALTAEPQTGQKLGPLEKSYSGVRYCIRCALGEDIHNFRQLTRVRVATPSRC